MERIVEAPHPLAFGESASPASGRGVSPYFSTIAENGCT
jgi:hypothetical protein